MTATGANPDRVTTMRTGEVLLSSVRAACHVFLARATDVLSVTITGSGSRRFGRPDARARQRARPLRASAGPLSRASNDTPTSVGLTSVVPSQDPRISTTKFREAALKEVDGSVPVARLLPYGRPSCRAAQTSSAEVLCTPSKT